MNPTGEFRDLRIRVMDDILARSFKDGVLGPNVRKDREGLNTFRRELMFCSLMTWEYTDAAGPFAGDKRLERIILPVLKRIGLQLPRQRFNKHDAGPGAYFCLVPFTRSLLRLKGRVKESWRQARIAEAEALAANAAAGMDCTLEYLNCRALECASMLNLHRLTGEKKYLDRCNECLDALVFRQYASGAQPYHTGMWIWGRKAAQVYQFLSASMMFYVGRSLGRRDAVEYVRRLMDYSLRATNRRGEAFVATFEGLHKAVTLSCAGRQWVCAAILGDKRFAGLARRTFEIYAGGIIEDPHSYHENFRHEALTEAMEMGVASAPAPAKFVPRSGIHALEDMSTVFVHQPKLDLSMTLLTGYSAFAEGDFGNVKLFALTPELTGEPSYINCGTDALRADWQKPTEQIECAASRDRSTLSGWVYTKWDSHKSKGSQAVHNRRLAVTMTYRKGELVLEFETSRNWQKKPIPSRLLFLLIARPFDRSATLTLAGRKYATPPAESDGEFYAKGPVGPVRFAAPDGSAIEIIPEHSTAGRVIAERPPRKAVPGVKHGRIKPANEGSLRLAFDGPAALDKGRYRIRFHPTP